jgi:hypothetical protein
MPVGMMLGGLFDMMRRVQRMAVRHVGVVRRLFVVAGFMVGRGFAVMFRCRFMMMGSQMMMFRAFVCHRFVSGFETSWSMRMLPPVYDMGVN